VKKPLRGIIAGLTLAGAAATGIIIATDSPTDTGSAPATTVQADTGWGTPPTDIPGTGTPVTMDDTGWG
jgi:hypothetical protein